METKKESLVKLQQALMSLQASIPSRISSLSKNAVVLFYLSLRAFLRPQICFFLDTLQTSQGSVVDTI